jgi:hypothetical protein
MTRHDIADMYGDELLFLDPEKFDDCIIGVATRCGLPSTVVYDKEKIAIKFIDEGMSYEEAIEYIAYNIEGAYLGETTPLIMERV